MLHLAICDDEWDTVLALEGMIHQVLQDNVIISKHSNPFSLLTYIVDEVKGEIDLIILDIKLGEQNGIEVAKTIQSYFSEIKVVFMTKYLKLAQDIFQISPVYFLAKPVELRYLRAALYKTMELIDEQESSVLILKPKYGGKNIVTFKVRDIYYIESDMRQLHIHGADSSQSLYMKMNEVERELPDNFCRCHQSFLVNMDKIRKITAEEILLFNDKAIPISRSKKKETLERLKQYLRISR